jgi:hypothetical protein
MRKDDTSNYDTAVKGKLNLIGIFKAYEVKINLKPVSDALNLNKEKIKLVQDY